MALLLFRLLALLFVVALALYILRRVLPRSPRTTPPRVADPYSTLGVSRTASDPEIREAYHRELAKYHPDKVNHLGEELQELARRKTAEIIAAYQSVSTRR